MDNQKCSFLTDDNIELICKWWLPEGDPKAVIIFVHGVAEHKGRYAHLAKVFNDAGIAAASYDHRGHGESPGVRILVHDFNQLSVDLDTFVSLTRDKFPGKPLFVLGHSMGSLVVGNYATGWKNQVTGFIFSALAIVPNDDIPQWMIKLSGIISKITPKLPILTLDSASLSHDPEVVKNYDEDPLNFRGGIPAITGAEMLAVSNRIIARMSEHTTPTMLIHGGDDKLVNVEGSKVFHQGISSEDKTLKIYPGLYHELINEYEKEEIMGEIVGWVTARS